MMHVTKVISLGDGIGLRIPDSMISGAGLTREVVIEEVRGGLLIRPKQVDKLSWEETYREMQFADEDWSQWQA